MKIYIRIILFMAMVVLISRCTVNDHWWLGKWQFDAEATNQYMAQSGQDSGILTGSSLGMIYSIYVDSQTTITEKEIIYMKNGTGKAKGYSVVEEPSSHQVVLKVGDSISTYTLEGNHMTTTATDVHGKQMKYFFEKVN